MLDQVARPDEFARRRHERLLAQEAARRAADAFLIYQRAARSPAVSLPSATALWAEVERLTEAYRALLRGR